MAKFLSYDDRLEIESGRKEILVPLINQGQSIHQIYLNNKDELMCSEKTLYNI